MRPVRNRNVPVKRLKITSVIEFLQGLLFTITSFCYLFLRESIKGIPSLLTFWGKIKCNKIKNKNKQKTSLGFFSVLDSSPSLQSGILKIPFFFVFVFLLKKSLLSLKSRFKILWGGLLTLIWQDSFCFVVKDHQIHKICPTHFRDCKVPKYMRKKKTWSMKQDRRFYENFLNNQKYLKGDLWLFFSQTFPKISQRCIFFF